MRPIAEFAGQLKAGESYQSFLIGTIDFAVIATILTISSRFVVRERESDLPDKALRWVPKSLDSVPQMSRS